MVKGNEKAVAILSTALEMEKKGMAFYEKAVRECKNPVGVDIFKKLGTDEAAHIERIKTIYESINGGQEWSDNWDKFKTSSNLGALFRDIAIKHGQNIKADANDIKALEIGIDFEQRSVDFYKASLNDAVSLSEKKFLELMIDEENGHRSVLIDMKYYLENPEAWFSEKERWNLGG